jgi:hypothetical protein
MLRQPLILKVFWGVSRSRRDCGNLEATPVLFGQCVTALLARVKQIAALRERILATTVEAP